MAYHACLFRDEGDFEPDSFRTLPEEHDGKRYDIIIGTLKNREVTAKQSFHYPTYIWTKDAARTH